MTHKFKQNSGELLKRIQDLNDDSLKEKVEKTEGVNGSTIEPIYSARKMRYYSVTESELKQLDLANLGGTAFASLGSATLAFAADILKDIFLDKNDTAEADLIIFYALPILLLAGITFWVLAWRAFRWSKTMIELVKEESTNP